MSGNTEICISLEIPKIIKRRNYIQDKLIRHNVALILSEEEYQILINLIREYKINLSALLREILTNKDFIEKIKEEIKKYKQSENGKKKKSKAKHEKEDEEKNPKN